MIPYEMISLACADVPHSLSANSPSFMHDFPISVCVTLSLPTNNCDICYHDSLVNNSHKYKGSRSVGKTSLLKVSLLQFTT